jgi:hypothetical protein
MSRRRDIRGGSFAEKIDRQMRKQQRAALYQTCWSFSKVQPLSLLSHYQVLSSSDSLHCKFTATAYQVSRKAEGWICCKFKRVTMLRQKSSSQHNNTKYGYLVNPPFSAYPGSCRGWQVCNLDQGSHAKSILSHDLLTHCLHGLASIFSLASLAYSVAYLLLALNLGPQ